MWCRSLLDVGDARNATNITLKMIGLKCRKEGLDEVLKSKHGSQYE